MADEARRQAREADRELAAGRRSRAAARRADLDQGSARHPRHRRRPRRRACARDTSRERDAPAIAHLRQAGAVFIGKTNLHEFAFGTTNEDSAFGPARNPHDPTRSPGGSSGGSAASVAAGMALATIGTDTGGSIRIPAAACGIVGLKPSFGEVSTDGVVPLSRTLDHVGPLAQTRRPTRALVYHALLGDASAKPPAPMPIHGLRLGGPARILLRSARRRRARAVRGGARAAARGRRAHRRHRDPSRGRHRAGLSAHRAGGCRRVSRGDARDDAGAVHAARAAAARDGSLRAGGGLRAGAGRARACSAREVDAALAQHDALVLPTLPIPAPPIGATTVQVGATAEPVRNLMLRLTQLFNVTGHPGDLDAVRARRPTGCRARSSSSAGECRPTRCCASRWPAKGTLLKRSEYEVA